MYLLNSWRKLGEHAIFSKVGGGVFSNKKRISDSGATAGVLQTLDQIDNYCCSHK